MNKEVEIWKPIIGFEGYYEISNFGRVKSLDRISIYRNIKRPIKGKILKASINKKHYHHIGLSNNKRIKHFSIHRLVAMHFIDKDDNKYYREINHIDGNPSNNHYSNLEWCSSYENTMHAIKLGLQKTGKHNKQSIKVIQYYPDMTEKQRFNSMVEAGKSIGINAGHISYACKTSNIIKGYIWKKVK